MIIKLSTRLDLSVPRTPIIYYARNIHARDRTTAASEHSMIGRSNNLYIAPRGKTLMWRAPSRPIINPKWRFAVEKNAFTMDNEPRRAPAVKYAKRIIHSTYARLSVAEGRKVLDRPIAIIAVHNVLIDTSIGRPNDAVSRGLCLSTCRPHCHLISVLRVYFEAQSSHVLEPWHL